MVVLNYAGWQPISEGVASTSDFPADAPGGNPLNFSRAYQLGSDSQFELRFQNPVAEEAGLRGLVVVLPEEGDPFRVIGNADGTAGVQDLAEPGDLTDEVLARLPFDDALWTDTATVADGQVVDGSAVRLNVRQRQIGLRDVVVVGARTDTLGTLFSPQYYGPLVGRGEPNVLPVPPFGITAQTGITFPVLSRPANPLTEVRVAEGGGVQLTFERDPSNVSFVFVNLARDFETLSFPDSFAIDGSAGFPETAQVLDGHPAPPKEVGTTPVSLDGTSININPHEFMQPGADDAWSVRVFTAGGPAGDASGGSPGPGALDRAQLPPRRAGRRATDFGDPRRRVVGLQAHSCGRRRR